MTVKELKEIYINSMRPLLVKDVSSNVDESKSVLWTNLYSLCDIQNKGDYKILLLDPMRSLSENAKETISPYMVIIDSKEGD